MDGFEPNNPPIVKHVRRLRFVTTSLLWLSIGSILGNVVGCASTQNAWRNLTAEPPSEKCTCGSCTCGEGPKATCSAPTCSAPLCPVHGQIPVLPYDQSATGQGRDGNTQQSFQPQGPSFQPQGMPQRPYSDPRSPAMQQPNQQRRSLTGSGTPNQWHSNLPGYEDQFQQQQGFVDQRFDGWDQEQPSNANLSSNTPAPADPTVAALKEFRAQVQVLSEQMSQVKTTQDSMKSNLETQQQAHERQVMEMKLEALQRERELEKALEKQQRQELENLDSISQLVESVGMSGAAFNRGAIPKPAATPRNTPNSATPTTQLPPVN